MLLPQTSFFLPELLYYHYPYHRRLNNRANKSTLCNNYNGLCGAEQRTGPFLFSIWRGSDMVLTNYGSKNTFLTRSGTSDRNRLLSSVYYNFINSIIRYLARFFWNIEYSKSRCSILLHSRMHILTVDLVWGIDSILLRFSSSSANTYPLTCQTYSHNEDSVRYAGTGEKSWTSCSFRLINLPSFRRVNTNYVYIIMYVNWVTIITWLLLLLVTLN